MVPPARLRAAQASGSSRSAGDRRRARASASRLSSSSRGEALGLRPWKLRSSMSLVVGTVHVQLLEQERKSLFEVGGDGAPHALRQRPEIPLERADSLLPGFVVELFAGVSTLPLTRGVFVQPA